MAQQPRYFSYSETELCACLSQVGDYFRLGRNSGHGRQNRTGFARVCFGEDICCVEGKSKRTMRDQESRIGNFGYKVGRK